MHSTRSNKETVKAGHAFAKSCPADASTVISDLASRLDVATVRANLMASEVLRFNSLIPAVIAALQANGEHMSLIADLNEALITPAGDQWIRALHVEAVSQARKYVQILSVHQQPGVSHCLNLLSQLETDLLRANQPAEVH